MGWKWIPLIEIELRGSETVRPAMAVEQQCQLLTHDLELGWQRNNRVPGAGNWDLKVNKYHRLAMVGFAYAPPGWKEKYAHKIAIVKGKQDGVRDDYFTWCQKGDEDLCNVLAAIS